MKTIEIPYTPRPICSQVIHPALDEKKRAVMVCHRRFGKSVLSINHMIKKAVLNERRAPQYAYIAPYRNQAKAIAWEYLKYYTNVIPGIKRNESELYVELPTLHKGSPGARIFVIGADKPDALRGRYLDGAVMDEYAQIKPNLYSEIIAPALADRDGFAWFIGTPKGQNQFYELYLEARKDERYFTCLYRADETNVFPPEKLEELKRDMTDIEYRQEMLCDFTASASNVVIPIDLVTEATARNLTPDKVTGMPKVLGVDVARFGDDDSVLQLRQGLWADKQVKVHGQNTMEVAAMVVSYINLHKPDAVFIDVGNMGAGVVDRVRQLGYPVMEVNFGQSAVQKDRYANIRAEMYFKLREWLQQGGCIPNDPALKAELTVTEYKFTPAGKIILQPKEEIKEMVGRSPDGADALALTFAYPVVARAAMQQTMANTEYNFGL